MWLGQLVTVLVPNNPWGVAHVIGRLKGWIPLSLEVVAHADVMKVSHEVVALVSPHEVVGLVDIMWL